MSEVNASEQVGRIFAQAQKLMTARQALVTAQMDADAAERELTRLNGSTNLDLSRFERLRFFECEGPAQLAVLDDKNQEAGGQSKQPIAPCGNIVQFSSWELDSESRRPKQAPVCDDCEQAIRAATPPKPTKQLAEASPVADKEIPF